MLTSLIPPPLNYRAFPSLSLAGLGMQERLQKVCGSKSVLLQREELEQVFLPANPEEESAGRSQQCIQLVHGNIPLLLDSARKLQQRQARIVRTPLAD